MQSRTRTGDGWADELGLYRLADVETALVFGKRARRFADPILYASRLALIKNGHQCGQAVQCPGKTGLGVEVHLELLDLVDGQAGIETRSHGSLQRLKIAIGGKGGDWHDSLLLFRQGMNADRGLGRSLMTAVVLEIGDLLLPDHAMSPLQYQKRMRLNEARRLMLTEHIDASRAAFQVGYESPSQFSREYSRQFGAPPMRDIKNLIQDSAG